MLHPLGNGCSRGLIATILAAALCAATGASAEIFKCVAKDKTPVYQNFPCQFSSMPSNLQIPKAAFVPLAATPEKPKAAPVNVALPVKPPDPAEPVIGMARDEIRALLGEPLEAVQDPPGEGIETWRYVNRTIRFDGTQRVVDLQSW